jgi:hypothetical protein
MSLQIHDQYTEVIFTGELGTTATRHIPLRTDSMG